MEDAGLLDMSATIAGIGLVVALVTLVVGSYRRWTINCYLSRHAGERRNYRLFLDRCAGELEV